MKTRKIVLRVLLILLIIYAIYDFTNLIKLPISNIIFGKSECTLAVKNNNPLIDRNKNNIILEDTNHPTLGLSVMTVWKCRLCLRIKTHSSSNTPILCELCSKITNRCNKCGNLLEKEIDNNVVVNINEKKYLQINKNVYYTNDLIINKARKNDSETIKNCYKIISDYLNEKWADVQIYISNFNYRDDENAIYFVGYRIFNNIILNDNHFTIIIRDNKIENRIYIDDVPIFFKTGIKFMEILNPDDVKEYVSTLARKNSKILLANSETTQIKGEYYLEYDEKNLYYKFDLNHGSFIKVNAITGEVIESFFFNGIYY